MHLFSHKSSNVADSLVKDIGKKDGIFPWASTPMFIADNGKKYLTSAYKDKNPPKPEKWLFRLKHQ